MNIKQVLNFLNKCKNKGFVYQNYSPNPSADHQRKYFTNQNAEIIDGDWNHKGFSSKGDPLHEIWSKRAK